MFDNIISVFADASFSDGIGGYAFWVRARHNLILTGSSGWEAKDISEVETIALCVATMQALDFVSHEPGVVLVLQSDSLHALGAFLNAGIGRPAKNSDRTIRACTAGDTAAAFISKVSELAARSSARVYLKHVKAHTGAEEGRSRVNAWCDQTAKSARRDLADCLKRHRLPQNVYPILTEEIHV